MQKSIKISETLMSSLNNLTVVEEKAFYHLIKEIQEKCSEKKSKLYELEINKSKVIGENKSKKIIEILESFPIISEKSFEKMTLNNIFSQNRINDLFSDITYNQKTKTFNVKLTKLFYMLIDFQY